MAANYKNIELLLQNSSKKRLFDDVYRMYFTLVSVFLTNLFGKICRLPINLI